MASIVDQINVRVDPAAKAQLDAAAVALGVSSSSLVRQIIDDSIPAVLERAKERLRRANLWPGGIPTSAVESALTAFTKAIVNTRPIVVSPSELLSAEGKALRVMLNWIWGEEDELSPAEKGAQTKLLNWFEAVKLPKPEIKQKPTELVDDQTQSQPVDGYRRRG